MRNIILIARLVIVATFAVYFTGIYAHVFVGDRWAEIFSTSVFFYTFILHPLVFFLIGRKMVKLSTADSVPISLLVLLLVLPLIPTTYVITVNALEWAGDLPAVTAMDIVFIVFESAALLAGIYVFGYYLRRYVKGIIINRDLISIHHYLFGTLIYFYFVRLTLISTLLITNI